MFNKDKSVDDFTITNAADYLTDQLNNRSGNAANRDRKNLAAAWSWGVRYLEDFPELHRKPNPFLSVEKFPEQRLVRYVPSVEDFWKIYEKTTGEQDRVMLLTFLHLGARRNEVFRLRWEDVDFFSRTVGLYTRKTRDGSWEYERLPMTDDLYETLRKFHRGRAGEFVFVDPETDRPFTSRQHWLKKEGKSEKQRGNDFFNHSPDTTTKKQRKKLGVPKGI